MFCWRVLSGGLLFWVFACVFGFCLRVLPGVFCVCFGVGVLCFMGCGVVVLGWGCVVLLSVAAPAPAVGGVGWGGGSIECLGLVFGCLVVLPLFGVLLVNLIVCFVCFALDLCLELFSWLGRTVDCLLFGGWFVV